MSITSELRLRFSGTQRGVNDFGGPTFAPVVEFIAQLGGGELANEADLLFVDERTVGPSATDDLDLAGVLQSALGGVITMAEIVALLIVNQPKTKGVAASLGTLSVGGGANPFVGFLTGTTPGIRAIGPKGMLLLFNPDASGLGTVTPATADILRITNSAAGISTYQIAILGRSA